jgi:hypothetical protein
MKFRINDTVRLLSDTTKIGKVIRLRRTCFLFVFPESTKKTIPERVIVKWNHGKRETVLTSDIELVRI